MDLHTDEGVQQQKRLRSQLKWDRKKKKFVQGTGEGADNVKIIKTESGARLPATYRTGRFDEWKKQHRTNLPRLGEEEATGGGGRVFGRGGGGARGGAAGGKRFKHMSTKTAKPLDKLSMSYERKSRQMAKKQSEAGSGESTSPQKGEGPAGKKKVVSKRFGGKTAGKAKAELKSVDQIRKARKAVDLKRAKNARPAHGGKKGKGKGRR